MLSSEPAYNSGVDSIFGRRTTDYPRAPVHWSPRIGFTWEPFGTQSTRIRGGAGIFAGSPPLGWLLGPLRSNGSGVRTLSCPAPQVPAFVADARRQPQSCKDGRDFSDGAVALVDPNLTMAESFKSSLAIDQRLPWNISATVEGLYSRIQSDFVFENVNLVGPRGIDRRGRVLYGSIDPFGRVQVARRDNGRFAEVIDLRNHSIGHSWSITAQLERAFSDRFEIRGSYTRSRTLDFQSLTTASALAPFEIWAAGRPLSGRHDDKKAGTSSFEIPHRAIFAATYKAPWKLRTDISVYYVGESGTPFTYDDSTAGDRGDLNADGSGANDPIYVPRNAADTSEIIFAENVAAQGAAFEEFIRGTPCLNRQRGKIVARNSCRGQWLHTSNLSIRQSLRATARDDLTVQVEVFNLLNLMNPEWGLFRVPKRSILEHVRQTTGNPSNPVFRFNPATARGTTQNLESAYQLQLSVRYSF
jgi:hypothetical protein